MEKVVVFGAGQVCKNVLHIIAEKFFVEAIIDTNKDKQGQDIYGVPIISLDEYLLKFNQYEIIIATGEGNYCEIAILLSEHKINNFYFYKEIIDFKKADNRERLISYSLPSDMEDVILYHVFKEADDIFYIDVGSNDPIIASVTQLLYDRKNARGINIEPQQQFIDLSNQERKRDINLCIGVGEKEGNINFYIQGTDDLVGVMSTAVPENINRYAYKNRISIPVTTLAKICEQYIDTDQKISFLKVDVEGYEKNVLLGADFKKYRPMVIVMESVIPKNYMPCYENWEYILLENDYHYVFNYGVNRYYVANECHELDERFIPVLELMKKYHIYRIAH